MYEEAIADVSEAIRLHTPHPLLRAFTSEYELHYALFCRACFYEDAGKYDQAIADYHELIRLNPKSVSGYNGLARLWASCPDDAVRDGKRAVEFATTANTLARWKTPACLFVLASAYAEDGQFDEAIKWMQKYLASSDVPKEYIERGKEILEQMREGKQHRIASRVHLPK
jgi:tetratricopeptide (TPR) repeat protein